MNRPKKYIFSLAAIVLTVWLTQSSAFSQSNNAFETEIKSAVADYDNAWNKKDVKAVSSMLSADYVYFTSLGGTSDRKSQIEFLSSPDYKLTFVERSEIGRPYKKRNRRREQPLERPGNLGKKVR